MMFCEVLATPLTTKVGGRKSENQFQKIFIAGLDGYTLWELDAKAYEKTKPKQTTLEIIMARQMLGRVFVF